MRDKVAICGVGLTAMDFFPDRSALSLAVEAFKNALDDAGLEKSAVDGLICLSFGSDYDRFLESVGLDVRFAHEGWSHGRFVSSTLHMAAMAVHSGLADVVAVVHGKKTLRFGDSEKREGQEAWRQGLGPHGESAAYGALAPAYGVALSARRYFSMYGGSSEDLGHIAVALRNNARLNPIAYRRDPLTIEQHQASRWIIDPLRLLDCCQNQEGGACILVTTADRAKDMKKPPVYIMGAQGVHAGPQYHNFAHVGLGVAQQDVFKYQPDDLRVYEMAGISRADVDSISVYDAFTPVILYALERFGFCGPGEALDFVREGNIELDGSLPVNTSGGLMSEGHVTGWNMFVEIARQLRGECGERQLKDANIIQWANFLGDSIIFRR
jgi:acetyl-CoA acetyltransferase